MLFRAIYLNNTTVLTVQAEGLPNITGKILSSGGSNDQFLADSTTSYLTASGALYLTSFRSTSSMANGSDEFKTPRGIGLDASKSNAVYGASLRVTPMNTSVKIWQRIN